MKKPLALLFCLLMVVGLLAGCTGAASFAGLNADYELDKISPETVVGNSRFAFYIFKQLNSEDGEQSIFISPLSISTALTMTYAGAETTTKEAMAKTLGYTGLDDEILNESYQNLIRYLRQVDKKIELHMGNSLWVREGEDIKEDFLATNKEIFDASVTSLDFSEASAVEQINKWIANATKNKITKMLEPPIPPEVVMYLINAIYFKGDWTEQFDKKQSYEAQFHAGDGSINIVTMMSRNGKVEYGQGDDYKAVRLPYGSGRTAMYCILPPEDMAINDFIATLDMEKWQLIRESMSERDNVELRLPRFELEYGIKELNDSLTALGMGEAFSEAADFSGIREGIFISRVLHKAIIEVNEEGSEAAAATVVEMQETAAVEPLTFIADRPFVFIIADDQTGTILFMGKLYEIK